jgi:hypothetical protein
METIGILPLFWTTSNDITHTVIHHETSKVKNIAKTRNGFTNDQAFKWEMNSAVFFPADRYHSSDNFEGQKTGVQIIGYR